MLVLVDHPLVQHKLTLLRKAETPTAEFRRLLREVSLLMAYEATRDLPMTTERIETPLASFDAPVLAGKKLCFVSILRAGSGILDGMLDLVPAARVGHIGLYRDPGTLVPVEYYFKLPEDVGEREAIVVDPMIATGHSAVAAVDRLKEAQPRSIRFVTLLAAAPGIRHFEESHSEVPVYAAAVDPEIDAAGFILPGMGDAGDRLFGTR
ncbi:MAG: uracil phosphoribosyltransferase [Rhodospirillales bacterium]|nr:uracil phosphoribosyltransferase [Rhodospirillales bacterium]